MRKYLWQVSVMSLDGIARINMFLTYYVHCKYICMWPVVRDAWQSFAFVWTDTERRTRTLDIAGYFPGQQQEIIVSYIKRKRKQNHRTISSLTIWIVVPQQVGQKRERKLLVTQEMLLFWLLACHIHFLVGAWQNAENNGIDFFEYLFCYFAIPL